MATLADSLKLMLNSPPFDGLGQMMNSPASENTLIAEVPFGSSGSSFGASIALNYNEPSPAHEDMKEIPSVCTPDFLNRMKNFLFCPAYSE